MNETKSDIASKSNRDSSVEREWPELIPDTPESIMRTLLSTPPKSESEWKYLPRILRWRIVGRPEARL